MWIILKCKLPTEVSPPKLSIFWSVPWPDDDYAKKQKSTCMSCGTYVPQDDGDGTEFIKERYARNLMGYCGCDGGPKFPTEETISIPDDYFLASEHNWVGARKIHYKGSDIRVFPDEFNPLTKEKMKAYVIGMENGDDYPAHDFVPEGVASESIQNKVLERDERFLYDAALVDGANHTQAMATAMEIDITMPDPDFPPIGWYRLRKEYAEILCYDWETKE